MKQFPERTPTQWANRYIAQLLSRIEELEKDKMICPNCGIAVPVDPSVVVVPEIVKKDIRGTVHACITSIEESRKKKEAKDETRFNR